MVSGQGHGLYPELADHPLTLNMYVHWLITIKAVKEESIRSWDILYRWHITTRKKWPTLYFAGYEYATPVLSDILLPSRRNRNNKSSMKDRMIIKTSLPVSRPRRHQ